MAKAAKPLATLIALWLWVATTFAAPHPANIPSAKLKIDQKGRFELRIRFDLLAFLLESPADQTPDPAMNALLDGPEEGLRQQLADGNRRFKPALHLFTDRGEIAFDSYRFPTMDDIRRHIAANPKQRLPVMMSVEVHGTLPKGAKQVWASYPDVLGVVVMTTEMPYTEPVSEPVAPGTTSTALSLPTPKQVANVIAEVKAHAKTSEPSIKQSQTSKPSTVPTKPITATATAKTPPPPPATATPTETGTATPTPSSPSLLTNFARFIAMGYRHILPEGLDHILFVLGLFLLSTRTRDLLKQITAFTIAHSLTLGLSLYGVVQLPSRIVEPIIAASIIFVAVENILTTELKPRRVYVVFGFGLIHGLGFASALHDLGLAKSQFLNALVGFNLGVELGQLSVVAIAFCLVSWYRNNKDYRRFVVIPASVLIALVAAFWTVQRVI